MVQILRLLKNINKLKPFFFYFCIFWMFFFSHFFFFFFFRDQHLRFLILIFSADQSYTVVWLFEKIHHLVSSRAKWYCCCFFSKSNQAHIKNWPIWRSIFVDFWSISWIFSWIFTKIFVKSTKNLDLQWNLNQWNLGWNPDSIGPGSIVDPDFWSISWIFK